MFQATNQTGILQGESTKADLLECIVTNGYKWLVNWDLTTKCSICDVVELWEFLKG